MFTFAVPSEIHKKEHKRKDNRVTKKTLQIMDIETIEICCVNTTLMKTRRCTQEPAIDLMRGYESGHKRSMKIGVTLETIPIK